MVQGPATPPLGKGSAQLQVNAAGAESLPSGLYAGTRLDQLTHLTYHTYTQSSTPAEAIMLQIDMDYDLNDAGAAPQGRLVYDPALNATVTLGKWQTWDAGAGRWYATAAPGSTVCSKANLCTLAQVIAAYPNAGIRVGATGSGDPAGQIRFVAGGWGVAFLGNVDAFTIGVRTPSVATQTGPTSVSRVGDTTITTYNFEPSDPTAITVRTFDAIADGASVVLHWETASETNLLGFRLWRSADAVNRYAAVGPDLIPAQLAPSGARYTWRDENVAAGRWYYKLETMTMGGTIAETFGPTSVVVGSAASSGHHLFLPLLTLQRN